jgi:hypothetical protein
MVTKKVEKVLLTNFERLRRDSDNYMNIKFSKLQEKRLKYIVVRLFLKIMNYEGTILKLTLICDNFILKKVLQRYNRLIYNCCRVSENWS